MPGFTLKIDGNIVEVKKTITELERELKDLNTQLKNALDPKAVVQLNRQIKQTEAYIRGIKNVAEGGGPGLGISKGASQATASLIDFSRIANDVPYGLVGIANNISPALEGFGRLKAETGSAAGALKAMGSQLIGPAGLGLAINLITSAFLIYQNGVAGFNRKTKEARTEAEKLAETLKSVKSVSDATFEGIGAAQGDIASVQALVAAVRDESLSLQERDRALKALKQTNKEYFGDLTLQADSLARLTPLVNEYTQALIQQAIVKELTGEIGKLGAVYAKQTKAVTDARKALNNYKESLNIPALDKAGNRTFILDNNIDTLTTTLKNAQKALAPTAQKFEELSVAIQDAQRASLQFKPLTDTGKGGKTEDSLKKQLEYYERIASAITDVNQQVEVGEKILDLKIRILMRDGPTQGLDSDMIRATIKGYQDEFQKVLEEQSASFELTPTVKFSRVIKAEIPDNISFFVDNNGSIQTKINDAVSKAVGAGRIPIITIHDARVRLLGSEMTAVIEEKERLQKELGNAINDAILGIKVEALTGLGEVIGAAIGGGMDGFKQQAKAMLSTIGGVVQQLGKYVITTALKIAALKKVIEQWAIANPMLAAAAGVGLVALGAVLKNVQFGGPKLAQGGITSGPTIAQIGEAGREAIIPLNKLPGLMAQGRGAGGGVSIETRITQREIVAWIMEGQRQFNRNY